MKKHTVRSLQKIKAEKLKSIQMLTCYDYQTALLLSETDLDLILVGDSVGNVILGYETTVRVTLSEMKIFSSAVKRGAKNKFVIADLPFGTYATFEAGIKNSIDLFQSSKVEALKLEGADETNLSIIKRLHEIGIPVMGHIGLQPQSYNTQGGYFIHGKSVDKKTKLLEEAKNLESAGAFAIVLECVDPEAAKLITQNISIPTIGIGSGEDTDGQVLVINDLLKLGPNMPPSFCTPISDLYETKKELIRTYLKER